MTDAKALVNQIATRVATIRSGRGMTQQTLSDILRGEYGLGWAATDISMFEKGHKTVLRVETLLGLSGALGVPLSVLLNDSFCPNCLGAPPRRFTCNLCGAGAPEKKSAA